MSEPSKNWLTWDEFSLRTGVPFSTFARWREKGRCPILKRKLRVKRAKHTGPHDGPKFFVHCRDAEDLERLRTPWNGTATIGGENYLSSRLAEEQHGLSRDRLYLCQATPCEQLGGKKVRGRIVSVVETAGAHKKLRRKDRWVWHAGDCAAIAKGIETDPDWLTHDEVKTRFGFGVMTLWEWAKAGCPHIDGRAPRSRHQKGIVERHGRQKLPHKATHELHEWFRPDLEEIAANHDTNPRASADPDWLTYKEAKRRFGFGQSTLSYWANENCPHLGRKLASKAVKAGVGNRVLPVLKYSRIELEEIYRKVKGRPAPRAATPTAPPVGNGIGNEQRSRGGRRRDEITMAVYEFCYTEYRSNGRKRRNVLRDAAARFGTKAPKEESEVTTYSNRHATRNNLPKYPTGVTK